MWERKFERPKLETHIYINLVFCAFDVEALSSVSSEQCRGHQSLNLKLTETGPNHVPAHLETQGHSVHSFTKDKHRAAQDNGGTMCQQPRQLQLQLRAQKGNEISALLSPHVMQSSRDAH